MEKRKIVLSGGLVFYLNLNRKAKVKAIGGNPIVTSFPARYVIGENRELTPIELQNRVREVLKNVY